jgi:hypothetical protein
MRGRTRSRHHYGGSVGSFDGSNYEDQYAYDDQLRGRSRSRYGRSRSRPAGLPIVGHATSHTGSFHSGSYPGGGYATSMPVGASMSQAGQPYVGGYGSNVGGMPLVPGQQYGQTGIPMTGSAYGGLQSAGMPQSASSYGSFGHSPTMSYSNSYIGGGGMMAGQPPMIIQSPHSSSHSHKHRHRSHRRRSRSRSKHHRSRSIEPYMDHYPAGYSHHY